MNSLPAVESVPAPAVPNPSVAPWATLKRRFTAIWRSRNPWIAAIACAAISLHLLLQFAWHAAPIWSQLPLLVVLAGGGIPLVLELLHKMWCRQFGSDLLAGISITTCLVLGEYLAGTIILLMLSGGAVLENYALGRASSVLQALSKRVPSVAHRRVAAGSTAVAEVRLTQVAIGDVLEIYPHEICPVDGVVLEGHGTMDESYLTGEPFQISKTSGCNVLSGAINGNALLTIRATRLAVDSRYAKIMEVMENSVAKRPRLRRLGDQLGAYYTPFALAMASLAWIGSGDPERFLAVLVIATPCPLLIAIPVAIIGAISQCARRAIIIKSPVVLEQISQCRTAIFDKTGTLTYGEPRITGQEVAADQNPCNVLVLATSLERYSKHPLARAFLAAAEDATITLREATEVSEKPGQGLTGMVAGHKVRIASRQQLAGWNRASIPLMPHMAEGLECMVEIDDQYAATFRFRDAPRPESREFVDHLRPRHHFDRIMIVSGDRESEVRYLAAAVGIERAEVQKTPEEKLAIVRAETARAKTLYVGDGINDAPAMMAATVGVAIGQNSEVTTEAADVVIMDSSLRKVDEFMHISRRMRTIALQSAVGGMLLSLAGMLMAASGHLAPVQGAVSQEAIDILAIFNALRAAWPPRPQADV